MKKSEENFKLYYSQKYNGFHVLYEEYENECVIGGCATFISDAYTNILRHKVKRDYFDSLAGINREKIENYPFIQKGTEFLPDSYLATEEIKDRTYLMYKDESIKLTWYESIEEDNLFLLW